MAHPNMNIWSSFTLSSAVGLKCHSGSHVHQDESHQFWHQWHIIQGETLPKQVETRKDISSLLMMTKSKQAFNVVFRLLFSFLAFITINLVELHYLG